MLLVVVSDCYLIKSLVRASNGGLMMHGADE